VPFAREERGRGVRTPPGDKAAALALLLGPVLLAACLVPDWTATAVLILAAGTLYLGTS
jgi:hypothetical protein